MFFSSTTLLTKIFQADNIIDSILPWYHFANVLGFYPYEIVRKDSNFRLQISKKGIFPCILLHLNFIYCLVLAIISDTHDNLLEDLVSKMDNVVYAAFASIFLLFHSTTTKKSFLILQKILEVDASFKLINISFPYKEYKKKFILSLLLSTIGTIILYFIKQTLQRYFEPTYSYYWHWSNALLEICRMALLSRSFLIIQIIRQRFAIINREISNIHEKKCCEYKIYKLRKIHDALCDICEKINEVEGIPNFLSLATMFIVVMANVYYEYVNWHFYNRPTLAGLFDTAVVVIHFMVIGFFLVPGLSGLANETKRTGILVHKILGETGSRHLERQVSLFDGIYFLIHLDSYMKLFCSWNIFRNNYFTGKLNFQLVDFSRSTIQ